MNNNQKLFCQEYVKNGNNGTKAYLEVYKCKSEKSAKDNASRLIAKDSVKEYISELQNKLEEKALVTAEEIIRELSIIAFTDRTKISKVVNQTILEEKDEESGRVRTYKEPHVFFTDTDELTDNEKKVISGYRKTLSGFAIDTYDKVKALELLGKYLGLFTDKVDISGKINVNPYNNLSEEELRKLAGG